MAKKRTKATKAASTKVKGARAAKTRKAARPAREVEPGDIDDRPGLTIVGVGASAGGLDAFGALLRALPPDPGFALVFVQHLAPQHESALVTLLSLKSTLPVTEARDGTRVEPNHVYVIAPNTQLVISSRELRITPRPDDRRQYTPIDAFLISLAKDAGTKAIAVILSGTASDGALGLREVKEAGGITLVQAPESAKYDGMLRAAIATGMVDFVLPPERIGAELVALAHAQGTSLLQTTPDLALTDQQLNDVFDLLRPATGVDFRHYKLPTIRRRLFRRMALHRFTHVGEYVQMLRSNPAEVLNLYRDLLIHVTRFFREPESFEAIARIVFPAVLDDRPSDQPIRAWVSGCASGEEAYSLAITLVEFLARRNSAVRVQIFATDVSESAVEQARAGVYPMGIESEVSPDRLRRFFTKIDGTYRVTKMIRDMCVFARQDLTRDPPFSRLDLILCRNVLIYMDLPLQKKLLSVFHYALNSNGFLALGQAETVGAQATLFSLIDKKFRVHRKRATGMALLPAFPADYAATVPAVKKTRSELPTPEKALQVEVNRIINDRFAPPGVVVDSDLQIVQFRGQTGMFLEPAPGEASLSLLKMAREGLLHGLRAVLNAARKSRGPARKTGLQVRSGKSWVNVDLEVIPLASPGRMHFLVLFEERARKGAAGRAAPREEAEPRGERRHGRSQVSFLQRELAANREYLQSIIQELEAANEELQSANEEILSSNEELQSTNEELDTAKEELQSTNEELNTVNEELQGRNEELSRVNSDLVNLLASVQISIVIVGADLRIRRFTPMAERVLNLIAADVDRSIAHINPNIQGADLAELIAECIDTIAPLEREVRDRQGRWYSLRIRPYRTAENKIDGAVLALFDIDTPKRHEGSVRSDVAPQEMP
jgi:two-component system CheB/CheR fusion protein